MASVVEAVADYIVANHAQSVYFANGVGTIIVASMPESPDNIVAVYEHSGQSPDFTMGAGGIVFDYPMIQIISRGAPDIYQTPRAIADEIRNLLAAVTEVVVSGVNFMRIEPVGNLNHLGQDAKRRNLISANFKCQIQR